MVDIQIEVSTNFKMQRSTYIMSTNKVNNAVTKGIQFEKTMESFLNESGLKATRTNVSNEYDPAEYKAGFDGGVDIIATFEHNGKTYKQFIFYIQCKCHETPLTKQAVSEVYAGMHARRGTSDISVAVVITTSKVSQETRQYAESLNVEIITKDEIHLIQQAMNGQSIEYGRYGILVKVMLYNYTKDLVWLDTLPESKNNLATLSMIEKYLDASKVDFDKAQTYLDSANSLERRAQSNRQKALDIQKVAVYRSLQVSANCDKKSKKSNKCTTIDISDDSG